MKKFFKFLGIIALVVIIGFSMAACGGGGDDDDDGDGVSVPSQLVGEWYDSDGQYSITIKPDGEIDSLRVNAFFFILPASTLGQTSGTIVFGYQSELIGPSGSFSYSINGNTMTISNSDYYDFPNGTYTKGSGGGNPQTATYTGTAGGTSYTLKVTGDSYELTAGTKKSSGTVNNVSGGVLTLKPSNAATTFTATVSGTSLIALNDTITWTDNTTAAGPGTLTGGTNPGTGTGGTLTITGIPEKYNGKYATFTDRSGSIMGCQSVSGAVGTSAFANTTFSRIANGRVSSPVWFVNADKTLVRYSGNNTFDAIGFYISEVGTYREYEADTDNVLAFGLFNSVTFTNGSATLSRNDANWVEYK